MLFGPASRVDFVAKFAEAGADIGVLDLEDATPPAAKEDARQTLRDAVPGAIERGSMKLLIRTNSIGSPHFSEDVEAATAARVDGIVVPKLETDREVQDVRQAMENRGLGAGLLCGGIESVAGVHRAVEVCGAGVDMVYFGAEDFVTDMGGGRTQSNLEVLYARSRVTIAAFRRALLVSSGLMPRPYLTRSAICAVSSNGSAFQSSGSCSSARLASEVAESPALRWIP